MTRIIIILAVLTAFAGLSFGQELKLGVVASELIVQNYPRFQQAEEQLSREMQTWQNDRKVWESDMERLQKEIENSEEQLRNGKMFSEKKKVEMQMSIDSLRYDFQIRIQKQSTAEQERFTQRRAELLAEVFEVVNGVIEEIGTDSDYDFIIDASNGTVVYAKEPDDLNDELLRRLQDK
ncbi:MAG: OmpH family outer membrane protein [Calditrichaeota bacterium]|jgi:outer membrane protein|nr:OmpH family outer membrane protein [Calditrichota bacterium]MBT7618905.1 OmpH family outer membrane protein [Calditrichota bacterium]MBT7789121.1 OmpH family outer membrane protein [Calditrichota bacterium]